LFVEKGEALSNVAMVEVVEDRRGVETSGGGGGGSSGESKTMAPESNTYTPRKLSKSIVGSMYDVTETMDEAAPEQKEQKEQKEPKEAPAEGEATEQKNEQHVSPAAATPPSHDVSDDGQEESPLPCFELTEIEHEYYDMLWEEITKELPDGKK
jgi:hypothetical protein